MLRIRLHRTNNLEKLMKSVFFKFLALAGVLASCPVFANSTVCVLTDSGETGVTKIQILWTSPARNEGVIVLTGNEGVKSKSKAVFKIGREDTRCGNYIWKYTTFGMANDLNLHLIKGGCPSSDGHGHYIEFPALLGSGDSSSKDAFSCDNF